MVLVALFYLIAAAPIAAEPAPEECLRDRTEGMLVGALIGDASGGPLEFLHPPQRSTWTYASLDGAAVEGLASSFRLRSYRQEASAYGAWSSRAAPGTLTDDSRHKIMVMRALRRTGELTARSWAEEILRPWAKRRTRRNRLENEWLKEYRAAALWFLGRSEKEGALPLDRLWSGLPTVSGQMALVPLAALYPGEPLKAYRAAWAADFMETGVGKDYSAAVVAGLARALGAGCSQADWEDVEIAMRRTDPYRFRKVPWLGRDLDRWLDLAKDAAWRSGNVPDRLYAILEGELNARVWWEAWVPIAVVFSAGQLAQGNSLAAMELALEFGHDTDTNAQLMGAFVGAMKGTGAFPEEMRKLVATRLKKDYGEDLQGWVEFLLKKRATP